MPGLPAANRPCGPRSLEGLNRLSRAFPIAVVLRAIRALEPIFAEARATFNTASAAFEPASLISLAIGLLSIAGYSWRRLIPRVRC
jgi:hypothetical protein